MMVERRRQRSGSLRPEPLEERRKRLAKLLSRSNKALRDGIQLSEAITGDGAAVFRHVLDGPRRHCVEAHRLSIRERPDAGMAEDEEPGFRAAVKPQTCGHSADTKVQGFRCGMHSHPS